MIILYHLIAALLAGLAFYVVTWLPAMWPSWVRETIRGAALLFVWWALLAFTPLGP